MTQATRQRIDAVLAVRDSVAQHSADIQQQLSKRRRLLQSRAVRSLTLSGLIRR